MGAFGLSWEKNKLGISSTLHGLLLLVIWLYALVTVVADLGWGKWAKNLVANRGPWQNGIVFAILVLLAASSVWLGYVVITEPKSASGASLAYASAFY